MAGYIGNAPVPQATQTRDTFTATAGQTSFATSGYTPNYLDVYLNGVKLPAEDYTATNGSDVVLDTGAALNDIVEVVAFSTFEVAGDEFTLTDITAQDSNGIQFNTDEGTERARIDDNGNLLVGKSSADNTTAGLRVYPTGNVVAVVNGANPINANRLGSDGEVIRIQKDSSTVGSIGTDDGDLFIQGGANVSYTGLYFNPSAVQPCRADGSSGSDPRGDGVVDLGSNGVRFKDLYLSGGVYLGGTGSANHLDDYEEGTWGGSATLVGTNTSATSISVSSGTYRKIGDTVIVRGVVILTGDDLSSVGDYVQISGLPFTAVAHGGSRSPNIGSCQTGTNPVSNRNGWGSASVFESSDDLWLVLTTTPSGSPLTSDNQIPFTVSYLT